MAPPWLAARPQPRNGKDTTEPHGHKKRLEPRRTGRRGRLKADPGGKHATPTIDPTGAPRQNATGKREIELGGPTPGIQHDVRRVAGQASPAGALKVALIDDFVPAVGDEFTILTAGSIAGTFETLDPPALAAGREWQVLYAPGGEPWVVLRVIDSCDPDCNQSGALTVADFGCFQGEYVLGCP